MKRIVKIGIAAALAGTFIGGMAWNVAWSNELMSAYTCCVCDSIVQHPTHIGHNTFCDGCAENANELNYATVENFEKMRGTDIFTDGFKNCIADYENPVWCDSCGEIYEFDEIRYMPSNKNDHGYDGWFCHDCYELFNN